MYIIFFFTMRLLVPVIFSRIGLTWVMPRKVLGLFACWKWLSGSPQSAAVWKIIPPYLLWCI
jgi:hypothetical protein